MIKNKERRQKGNDKKANEDCFNGIFANIYKKKITVAIMILMAVILTIAGKKHE